MLRMLDPETPPAIAAPVTGAPTPFAALGLAPALVRTMAAIGYETPTPIQTLAIPPLLAGHDLVGQAQTGTGKTAAFGLPLLQSLDLSRREVQGLILCPTRELAIQVSEALRQYGEGLGAPRVLTVYGGAPIHTQLAQLRGGVHVVVGTPGRVMDCIRRGALALDAVRNVVLDEGDEMLRMGFIDDVEWILGQVPKPRQIALFSATLPPAIERVAKSYLVDPVSIAIESATRTVTATDQRVIVTHANAKVEALARFIEAEPTDAVIVFARTRSSCALLVDDLRARGVAAAALHGDLSQAQREEVVGQLKARRISLVVATDVAARGLDVDGISHVVNFDPPLEPEVYVHRIGRTGRAGRPGVSLLLLTPRERAFQRTIERYTGQTMRSARVPNNRDLAAARATRLTALVHETVAAGDLEPYRGLVERMAAEPGADLLTLAAAMARLASREQPLVVEGPEPEDLLAPRKFEARNATSPRGAKSGQSGAHRPSRPGQFNPGAAQSRQVRLFVTLGEQAGLRPGDLVGAVANEAGIPGKAIGAIDIREKISFLEVDAIHVDAVLASMGQFTIRGRKAAIVLARPETGPPKGRGPKFAPKGHRGGGDPRDHRGFGPPRDARDRKFPARTGRDDPSGRKPWAKRDVRPR
ncbi:MAG: DEAD/DEAH box helicase [Planctomycetota bacterium]